MALKRSGYGAALAINRSRVRLEAVALMSSDPGQVGHKSAHCSASQVTVKLSNLKFDFNLKFTAFATAMAAITTSTRLLLILVLVQPAYFFPDISPI